MKKILLCFVLIVGFGVRASEFILPPEGINVVGQLRLIHAKEDETLLDIAREYDVGYNEIIHANPDVDRWYPGENTPVVIPTRYVLPDTPRSGLVLNLPEMRIYYYPKAKKGEVPKVVTYPVGIGRMDWKTPLGKTSVTQKKKNPTWTPTVSIRKEHAEKGDPLPAVVAAGPDNPLGTRALRLGLPSYLIHGTNKPYGVGMRVSHGCVRLRREDIEALFDIVPLHETVRIINQPLKIGHFAGELFLEFHEPLEEDHLTFEDNYQNALQLADQKINLRQLGVSNSVVKEVVKEASGIPVEITF